MVQDETIKALERAAAEVSPEVVRWINALRRAGELTALPEAPKADSQVDARGALVSNGNAYVAGAWRPDEGQQMPRYVATNHCPMALEDHIVHGVPVPCGRDITHYVEFDDDRGTGILPCCEEHTIPFRDAISAYMGEHVAIPTIHQAREYPRLRTEARRPRASTAGLPSGSLNLPPIFRNAFIHAQMAAVNITCQHPMYAHTPPRGSHRPNNLCGVRATRHIVTRDPREMHIYTCDTHHDEMMTTLQNALRVMIGAQGAGGWTVHVV